MRKQFAVLLAAITSTTAVFGQLKSFTLEDAVLKQYSEYYPKRIRGLQWTPDGHTYVYLHDASEETTLRFADAETGKDVKEITLSELNEWADDLVTFADIPSITWIDGDRGYAKNGRTYFEINFKKQRVELKFTLPEGAEAISFNKQFTACAYIKGFNFYFLKADGTNIQVTSDGKEGIVYGQAVHRQEFGIHDGIFWSPDGDQVAFYRMDETMVGVYPLVDISAQPAALNNIRYPMAGTASHHVKLGVFNPKSVKTVYMETGEPKEQYLTSVTWAPKGDKIYIALLNRDQNQLKLNRYAANSGAFEKTLFEEADDAYVEPENPLWFLPHDDGKFLWQSERSGFNGLYLYDTEGTLIRRITTGDWEVERIIGFDDTKNYLFVEGTGETITEQDGRDDTYNATQRFTYMIDFALSGKQMVDNRLGTHTGSISADGKYLFEHFSSIETPWETTMWRTIGKKLRVMHQAEDPHYGLAIGTAELITCFSGGPGLPLYGRIIKPSDFDPAKKYPVVLYVYGGPHAQLVHNTFRAAAPMWMYWMAEQGYIVATVDNRGSENRGLEFEQSTFRELGTAEMEDQIAFIHYLRDLPYVDTERVGVHGWSYGGFMTMNLLLSFPEYFEVGVAGGPVCDWSMYEVMYTERYMDTPETNPEGFEKTNLVNKASQLKDDLLVIHGTVDDVVVWQHSQAFVKACVDAGVQLDYFMYPGHPHNVRGKDRVHLMEKVLGYMDEKLSD